MCMCMSDMFSPPLSSFFNDAMGTQLNTVHLRSKPVPGLWPSPHPPLPDLWPRIHPPLPGLWPRSHPLLHGLWPRPHPPVPGLWPRTHPPFPGLWPRPHPPLSLWPRTHPPLSGLWPRWEFYACSASSFMSWVWEDAEGHQWRRTK